MLTKVLHNFQSNTGNQVWDKQSCRITNYTEHFFDTVLHVRVQYISIRADIAVTLQVEVADRNSPILFQPQVISC